MEALQTVKCCRVEVSLFKCDNKVCSRYPINLKRWHACLYSSVSTCANVFEKVWDKKPRKFLHASERLTRPIKHLSASVVKSSVFNVDWQCDHYRRIEGLALCLGFVSHWCLYSGEQEEGQRSCLFIVQEGATLGNGWSNTDLGIQLIMIDLCYRSDLGVTCDCSGDNFQCL